MTTQNLYRDYFNIDPKYYAAVTADLIEQGKVSWKGFYPHETFVKLLETTHKVLSGAAHRSIWVAGAYGTGKSHAALTVKSLLDASDEETEAYFDDFKLSHDLRDKFIALKNGGKIITIHRIGSADIHTDTDLILAVQQSMTAALKAHGIENQGDVSMKDAFLKWLESNPANRAYFDALIHGEKYLWDFSGMGVGDVEERLKTASGKDAESLMRRVMKALKENGQYGLFRDMNDMAGWIKSVIEENHLSAVLFIWDEFSEYFKNHPFGLTGFQTLIEISQSHPFYFMIVVHGYREHLIGQSGLFADKATARKILDRFEDPVQIELPDNMAFRLMAQAMKTSDDPVLQQEWAEDKASLITELEQTRHIITEAFEAQKKRGVIVPSDKDLQDIVPIHPYAALVLKNIATTFTSNQRSMFDFIISNDMTDAKGFKWFISEYGVYTDPNLLTVDLLWDFFYGKERAGLNDEVRGILECYNRLQGDKLLPEERRVLKTVLLLQAIYSKNSEELLSPTEQHLDLAFAGTDWQKGKANAIAKGLVEKKLLFKKAIGGGKTEFSAVILSQDEDDIKKYREKVIKETTAQSLIVNGALLDALTFPPALKQRFVTDAAGYERFTSTAKRMGQETPPGHFPLLATFAMTDDEAKQTRQKILQSVNQPDNRLIFVETLTPMGNDLYEQYADNMAYSLYHAQKNKEQAAHFQKQAMSVLSDWRNKIGNGAFMLYDSSRRGGERMSNLEDLFEALREIDYQLYPYGLEHYSLNSTLYGAYQPAVGAECGITQTVKGAYKNPNKNQSVENALNGAWQVENYWKDPSKQSLPIVHIKKRIDEIVQQGFDGPTGQVSMMEILEEMEKPPFGFMPSSITALVLGFTLKEYVREDYFWSDGLNSQAMNAEKMKNMISGAIGQRINPNPKNYRTGYIRAMSADMRAFLKCSASVFDIPAAQCGSVESVRDQIRVRMKGFSFPLWCATYALDNERLESSEELTRQTLNDYMGIANTANSAVSSESELAERIGHGVSENPGLVQDLGRVATSEKCREGMLAYLASYREGELPALAAKIEDNGAYLEQVRKRFSAGDANWVWNISTANEKIDDVILEYHIIDESCKTLGKFPTLQEVVNAWNLRTNNIKISCEAVASHTGDLAPLLKQLLYMKQGNGIQEQNKTTFYNLLVTQRENFDRFYKDQVPYFTRCASAFLSGLQPEEIAELYHSLPKNQFAKSRSAYYSDVEEAVKEYLRKQWVKKLRDVWYQKTRTKDPSDWSDKYETPLLCMFGDAERPAAREMFRILMSVKPEESAAKKALEYLETATFYDRLSDEAVRDKCFKERVVGDYAILLRDLNKTRRELRNNLTERPYEWMDNASVQNELRRLADKEYKLTGCDRAMEIINAMNPEQLRVYLRDKIQDDADFGMQILKGTT